MTKKTLYECLAAMSKAPMVLRFIIAGSIEMTQSFRGIILAKSEC